MPVLELNNPLIVDISGFDSLEKYISSLTKSSKKDLKSIISKNYSLEYSSIPFDSELVQKFMDLWENQPLSNGMFPLWNDWNSETILSGHKGETILFCAKIGGEIIAVHFVFRWDNYVYCNAPLYDKSRFKKISLGKWMWVNMFSYFIKETSVKYVDLVGPEGSVSWSDIISGRDHPSDSGDFGYKWRFVPEEVKKNPESQTKYLIKVCKSCGWKGLSMDILNIKCNCMLNLLIVAHPDDEAIFFGNWLLNNALNTKVVCITGGLDPIRKEEFKGGMNFCGVDDFEIWDYEYSLSPLKNKNRIIDDLYRVKFSEKWDRIITHGRYGEYGHIQHIEVHEIVTSVFDNDKIYVYEIGKERITGEELSRKIELNRIYASQYKHAFLEILNSTVSGSDWYKHTMGNNMVEYESVVPLSEYRGILNIAIIDPIEYKDYPFYALYQQVLGFLVDRGNKVEVRTEEDDLSGYDISLVFILGQAIELAQRNEKFIFLINNDSVVDGGLSPESPDQLKWVASKSVRTIVRNKATRDVLGNADNVVFWPLFRNWYEIIRDLESNMLMGMRWWDISGSFINHGDFYSFKLHSDRISFFYMGRLKGEHDIFLRNRDEVLVRYQLNLEFGNNYWIGFYREWAGKELFLEILKDGNSLYVQDLPKDLRNI